MTETSKTPRTDAHMESITVERDGAKSIPLERAAETVEFARGLELELAAAIQSLSEAPAKWIPVVERVPEDRISVIVYSEKYGGVQAGEFYVGLGVFYEPGRDGDCIYDATHWMPLPEAPKP